jgi:dTMP kinase
LIVLEGIDGSGKTTQSFLLVEELKSRGYKAEYTTEPTYGRVGNILRLHVLKSKQRMPVYEALLYATDRYEHVKREIEPKLKKGVILISDRYLYSSLAYQGAAGVSLSWLRELNNFTPKPDMIFYLDVPPGRGLDRKKGKKSSMENIDNVKKVRRLYLQMAEEEHFINVNAVKGINAIRRQILSTVLENLSQKT